MTFEHIAYMPIDAPLFEYKQEIEDAFYPERRFNSWDQLYVLGKKEFEPIVDFFMEFYPYESLSLVILRRLHKTVPPHLDMGDPTSPRDILSDEELVKLYNHHEGLSPSGYKLLLKGSRDSSFFVCKDINSSPKHWKYVKVPELTDSFVIPETDQFHGALKREEDRLIVYAEGYVNKEQHYDLLNRSYEKYKDYVIYRNDLA